jgi:actin-like protein 6A
LNHSYNYELGVKSNEHAVMLSEVPFTTREQREKTISLLFEKFDVPAFFLAKSPVLSTFACGKTTATVIDSGAGTTCVTPVHDGYALVSSLIKNHHAGEWITDKILELIEKKMEIKPNWSFKKIKNQEKFTIKELHFPNTSKSFTHYCKKRIVDEIKESMFQISESHFDSSKQTNFPQISFELNTGNTFDFGMERYSIPEYLFSENQSISQMCYDSIMKADADIRKELFSNIVNFIFFTF